MGYVDVVAGRPRSVDDATIFDAVGTVIGRGGPVALTLAAVGQEVGLTASALAQRFGSKRGLLVAFAEHGAGQVDEAFGRATARGALGLDAIRRALVSLLPPAADRTWVANHLAVLHLDLTDPELRPYAVAHARSMRRHLRSVMVQAQELGEIPETVDLDDSVRAVEIAYHGAVVAWAIDGTGALSTWVRQAVDAAIAPLTRR